jgi:molybdopterin biosynthesis enzyme MoaB
VPTAVLSRQTAGLRGQSLILNLPGKPKSIRETIDEVGRGGVGWLWGGVGQGGVGQAATIFCVVLPRLLCLWIWQQWACSQHPAA